VLARHVSLSLEVHFKNLMQCKHCKPGAGGHDCNPSHSGGRDQEDGDLKPALGNSS
jgi:hypothetical protein